MADSTAVVARQPIVDRDLTLVGYELLFRPLATSDSAFDPEAGPAPTGDEMTNRTIFNALGLGIERLTGGALAFCNADRGVLTGQIPVSLPPKQTVIEVLENVPIDDEVLAGCRALGKAGYQLAADDFVWSAHAEDLLDVVDIVKIDLRATAHDSLAELIGRLRGFGVRVLAEKIETAEELQMCQDLGFDLFQGFYVGRPATVSGPALRPSRLSIMQLAAAVLDDDVEYETIDKMLRTEPELSYQLIQLAAIGRFGEMKREITSTRQALVWIGLNRLRGWIPALLLRPAGRAIDTSLPAVLGRARLAELLAQELFPAKADLAFTAGMLSAFDLLLGVPRANLPAILDIPPRLRDAAFGGHGEVGRLIEDVIDYEQYGSASPRADSLSRTSVGRFAAQAFGWAMRTVNVIDEAA